MRPYSDMDYVKSVGLLVHTCDGITMFKTRTSLPPPASSSHFPTLLGRPTMKHTVRAVPFAFGLLVPAIILLLHPVAGDGIFFIACA